MIYEIIKYDHEINHEKGAAGNTTIELHNSFWSMKSKIDTVSVLKLVKNLGKNLGNTKSYSEYLLTTQCDFYNILTEAEKTKAINAIYSILGGGKYDWKTIWKQNKGVLNKT